MRSALYITIISSVVVLCLACVGMASLVVRLPTLMQLNSYSLAQDDITGYQHNNKDQVSNDKWSVVTNMNFLNLALKMTQKPNLVIIKSYTSNYLIYALISSFMLFFLFSIIIYVVQRHIRNWRKALEQEEKFKSLVEQSHEYAIITLDLNGFVTSWNKGAEKIVGYTSNEIIGKHYSFFYLEENKEIDALTRQLGAIRENNTLVDEGWRLRKDGSQFYASITYYPVYSSKNKLICYSNITKDLTELKLQKDQLNDSNSKLAAIFISSHLAIISTDLNGLITSFNPSAEKILGYKAEELIGVETLAIFHDSREIATRAGELTKILGRKIEPKIETFVAELESENVVEREWTYISKSGRRTPVLLSVTSLRNMNNKVNGYLLMAIDITSHKIIEKAKNEFISVVSHELRTPLTSIHGSITLLAEEIPGKQEPEALTLLKIALKNTDRLIRLINDILDIEKMKSGKMQYTYSLMSAKSIVNEAIAINIPFAHKFKARLESESHISSNLQINVDHDKLLQAITNLISNAVKFSPDESEVRIVTTQNINNVCIEIRDYGSGIPEAFKNNIFQRFSQADSSTARKQQGSGLGLNICKTIIEEMGGSIYFKSDIGVGTSFFIELPIHVEALNGKSAVDACVKSEILTTETYSG
jgi:PAS domain S-box-containing protein